MKLNFKRNNKTSFLIEIGKQKRSININVDDSTFEPKGKCLEKWDFNNFDTNEWSLYYYLSDEYGIEFLFKKENYYTKTLEPLRFVLWGSGKQSQIIDEGCFSVEIV